MLNSNGAGWQNCVARISCRRVQSFNVNPTQHVCKAGVGGGDKYAVLFSMLIVCHFLLLPSSVSLVTRECRIKEVADKINKYGSQTSQVLQSLKASVKQVVVGTGHLGILLDDGRALRVAFSVIPERLDLSKGDLSKM